MASFEVVEFNDTSLGRPQPGQDYAKVVTPGFIFTFTNGEVEYTYHTDSASRVVLVKKSASR